jgi:linoleoyl-CoA desaturase
MKSFAALREELRKRGYFEKAPVRIISQLAFEFFLIGSSAVLFLSCDNLLVRCVAVVIAAVASLAVSTNGHTSSHYATSDKKWINELLTFLCYPLCNGISAAYWWHKHIVGHHPAPNVIGLDGDIELMPWFAYTEEEYRRGSRLRRLYYRCQGLFILPVIGLLSFQFQAFGWKHLLGCLFDKKERKPYHFLDLALLLVHLAMWYVLPLAFFPPGDVLYFNLGRFILAGYAMFCIFAPAHFPAEAAAVEQSPGPEDFVLLQTATTVNFRTGFFGRWLCSGVEYQIEHHLFCNISHVHYPAASKLVEEFCRENGYPYRTLGWGEAVWKSYLAFWKPKKVEARLEDLRPATAEPQTLLVPRTRIGRRREKHRPLARAVA